MAEASAAAAAPELVAGIDVGAATFVAALGDRAATSFGATLVANEVSSLSTPAYAGEGARRAERRQVARALADRVYPPLTVCREGTRRAEGRKVASALADRVYPPLTVVCPRQLTRARIASRNRVDAACSVRQRARVAFAGRGGPAGVQRQRCQRAL